MDCRGECFALLPKAVFAFPNRSGGRRSEGEQLAVNWGGIGLGGTKGVMMAWDGWD